MVEVKAWGRCGRAGHLREEEGVKSRNRHAKTNNLPVKRDTWGGSHPYVAVCEVFEVKFGSGRGEGLRLNEAGTVH